MVHIVVAGGTGNVAREIVDILVKEKHHVTIFSRKDVSSLNIKGVTAVQVDYTDKDALIKQLRGVNTVLSFIVVASDPSNIGQKTLIDASIEAGWYASKDEVHEYLRQVNKERKVLEYTLFQPGLFLNYFAYPYKSAEHFHAFEMSVDFQNYRAIVLGDGNDQISLTTVQDLGVAVAAAIDYEGGWPEVGGVRGGQITISNLIKLGEAIRGKPFVVDQVTKADVEAWVFMSSWIPSFTHPNLSLADIAQIPEGEGNPQEFASKMAVRENLLAIERGAWDVSDEWNQIFPQLKLTGIEEFLRTVWEGKP